MDSAFACTADYVPGQKATCVKCKGKITKDSLRVSKKVQAKNHDGNTNWAHHLDCLFENDPRLRRFSQINNFDNLRWDDQEKIRKMLVLHYSKGNPEFSVQYAKSTGSICGCCHQTITESKVCISKHYSNSPESGNIHSPTWYDLVCFIQNQHDIGFFDSVEKLSGFRELRSEDQETLKRSIVSENVIRTRNPNDELTETLREQNNLFFEMRDKIKRDLEIKEIKKILEKNKQFISTEKNKNLDLLADCLAFGALEICPECKKQNPLKFMNNTYVCSGHITAFARCPYVTKSPHRQTIFIPEELQDRFRGYESVVKERKLRTVYDDFTINLPLDGIKIVLFGSKLTTLKNELQNLGARILKDITDQVLLCIISEDEIDSNKSNIKKAKDRNVHVVSKSFFKDIMLGYSAFDAVDRNVLYSGGNFREKFELQKEQRKQKSEALKKRKFVKAVPEKVTVPVKGAAAVDWKEYQETHHVYQKDEVYSAVLVKADASINKNSFYNLQVLESDQDSSYIFTRRWGRVGTSLDGKRYISFDDVEKAIDHFKKTFFEKTNNKWENRSNFQMKPGFYHLFNVDYGQDSDDVKKLKADNSRTPKTVQDLICLIFDLEMMRTTIIEFEIDLNKMPLGKISETQICDAYAVLEEAIQMLSGSMNKSKITDLTNRFLTLIPHVLGMKKPPLLENEDIIRSKMEMLNTLQQIEFAYRIINKPANNTDRIDEYYENLNTDIEVMEKGTNEYLIIEKYLKNTHSCSLYPNVELLEVFRVSRHHESEAYKNCRDFPNKKLLWHGSRVCNFAGILSQGLGIAPPGVTRSGNLFGDGVYFADTIAKSHKYCRNHESVCLLLLCEVALGNMYEIIGSRDNKKELPAGKNSIFVMGRIVPDPEEKDVLDDIEVPCGRLKEREIGYSCMHYNEYIVFDVNQIHIKYLVAVKFQK